jgi:hypothetical protein
MASSVVGLSTLVIALLGRVSPPFRANVVLLAWLSLALGQYQNVFQMTTFNDADNCTPYVGIYFAALVALVLRAFAAELTVTWERGARRVTLPLGTPLIRLAVSVGFAAIAALSAVEGMATAAARRVQDFPVGTIFRQRLQVEGASRVLWGEPTRIRGEVSLDRRDFEALTRHLRQRAANFFVFPDSTLLYGLTGRPSPQPWVYFHEGQSFSSRAIDEVGARVRASLERNQVDIIVIEKDSYLGTAALWPRFGSLDAWVRSDFERTAQFGIYDVFERRAAKAARAEGP